MSRRSPLHDGSAESLLHATLARNLRAARKRKGLTQAQTAEALGVSTHGYGSFENCRRWPSVETLRAICEVLDVSADTLLGIEPEQGESAPALPSDDPPGEPGHAAPCRDSARRSREAPRGPTMKRAAPAPGSIIIPAATLPEFIERAIDSYGSIRSAADGIAVPYSTFRGWKRGRYLMGPTPERSGDALFEHLEAANENATALRAHLDAIERMTGRG